MLKHPARAPKKLTWAAVTNGGSMIDPFIKQKFRHLMVQELVSDILPFWMIYTVDLRRGGFYGIVTNERKIAPDAPRSAVICARILWTYSNAYRAMGNTDYSRMATHAYKSLTEQFQDKEHGGFYWMLNADGSVLNDRKQLYAQAFALYGISEYTRFTRSTDALNLAKDIFHMIEEKSYDPQYGGYFEAYAPDWSPLEDMRLSEKDLNSPKSMNTLLHILEAYTTLAQVWVSEELRDRLAALLEIFLDKVIDPHTHHFKLFFSQDWISLDDHISYGHDIEGSWLLMEAADVLRDKHLHERTRQAAIDIANAVYAEGLDSDGSLLYEADSHGITDARKHWWAQAEAVVGFYNAYTLTQEQRFFDASFRLWDYIEKKVIDRRNGEWFAMLERDGTPVDASIHADQLKVGAWKCPYHNARTCLEMSKRLT
jgi:mannobiose 2-epimerase